VTEKLQGIDKFIRIDSLFAFRPGARKQSEPCVRGALPRFNSE